MKLEPEPGLESALGSDVAVVLGSGTGAAVRAVDVALGSGADVVAEAGDEVLESDAALAGDEVLESDAALDADEVLAVAPDADAGPESDVADALGRTSRSAWRA